MSLPERNALVGMIAHHFKVSREEVWDLFKTPQHPADMRDTFAALAMQAAAINPVGAEGFTFEQRAEWSYAQA